MVAFAYVDGFSLYHNCFRGERNESHQHEKWLDLVALARLILPNEEVVRVRYFTTRVGDSPEDPSRAARQDAYLRALATLPEITLHQGKFARAKRDVRLVKCPPNIAAVQTAYVRQEKRSDVALATNLLMDAIDDAFTVALLLSNDSDFMEPVKLVASRFGRRVIVISPDVHVAKDLARVASFARPLDRLLLAEAQLPNIVTDVDGREIHRPSAWT